MGEGCLQGWQGFKPGSHRSQVPSGPQTSQGCCSSSPSCFFLGHLSSPASAPPVPPLPSVAWELPEVHSPSVWNPGVCLSLCMLGQHILQPKIQVGCILTRQSWGTSHCQWKHGASACGIRSSAKNPHPSLPVALRGLGQAARFGMGLHLPILPRLVRGKPAFPVPTALLSWSSSGGFWEAWCCLHHTCRNPTWPSGGTGGKIGQTRSGPCKANAVGLQQELRQLSKHGGKSVVSVLSGI